MKKILLTGGSGFLGSNFIKNVPRRKYELTAVYNTYKLNYSSINTCRLNLLDFHAIENIINRYRPDFVIHLAASSNTSFCQKNPEDSYKNNVVTTENLVELSLKHSIHLVFTSSDMVFDGRRCNYSELDETSPLNVYGKQKLEAEDFIISNHPDAAICRMPLMYGEAPIYSSSFIQQMIDKFSKGEESLYFSDEYRSVLFAEDAVSGLILAAENFSGIYHLGGRQSLSRFEIAMEVADIFGFDPKLAKGVRQSSVKHTVPRPKDVSLNSSKAYSSGFSPRTLSECLGILLNSTVANR